ncbi:hypothetical protein AB0M79_21350 [Polymorphospora sp. NPDC051019]|uniref:hypothetical protein n=1 Tax=Polymorphospora sp. NPDC051019 TaxID=3155725 RepID=UPI0034395359
MAVLVAASLTSPTSAASAVDAKPVPTGAVPGGFATWSELIEVQTRLNAAADKVEAAKNAGFAGLVAAPENRELRVYWKGDAGTEVRSLIADLNHDVPVRLLPARFSEAELANAARGLTTVPNVVNAIPKVDGSGIQLTVSGGDSARAGAARAVRDSTVPVTVVAGEKPVATYNRQADVPLYVGGSRFRTPIGECTTGFAIFLGPNSAMLTAGHCGENGQSAYTGAGVWLGSIHSKDTCQDTMIIGGAYSAGRVYTGDPYSNNRVAVGGVVPNRVGNWVTTSGATSGERNSVQITATGLLTTIAGIPCAMVGPLIQARHTGGQCAVAPGDSGGPVVAYRTDGKVNALGTITAGSDPVPDSACPGTLHTPGYNYVYYSQIPITVRGTNLIFA